MSNNDLFQYTYSADEQEEVKHIREKYIPREESPIERLRRMDARVGNKATVGSLVLGVFGLLIFGLGMTCCLEWGLFLVGILISIPGLIGISLAYPLYQLVLKKERERVAPEILRLTDELLK